MDLDINDPMYRGFVGGLRADRHSETPYLVFADWLDEHYGGHPFATFVRSSCEANRIWPGPLTYMGPDVTKPNPISSRLQYEIWQSCVDGLKAYWLNQPFFAQLSDTHKRGWGWRYGFPCKIFCSTWHWLVHGHQICAMGPVGEVVLTDKPSLTIVEGVSVVEISWGHANPTWAQPKNKTVVLDADDYYDTQADRYSTTCMIAMRMLTEIYPEEMVEEFRFNARL